MEKYKNALQSRTVWSAIVGFGFVIADLLGFNFGMDESEAIDAIMKMVEGGLFLAAGWFRYVAQYKLTLTGGDE